jgi:hypothetical protein
MKILFFSSKSRALKSEVLEINKAICELLEMAPACVCKDVAMLHEACLADLDLEGLKTLRNYLTSVYVLDVAA